MVVLFIIIISGFLLQIVLQPSADVYEVSTTNEILPEISLHSTSIAVHSDSQQTLTTSSTKEE
jgi:hypothetical protein